MQWISNPEKKNVIFRGPSWCPCMGGACCGNNPPFCSIKTSHCKKLRACAIYFHGKQEKQMEWLNHPVLKVSHPL